MDGSPPVLGHAGEDEVDVLLEGGVAAHLGGGLPGGLVELAARLEDADRLVVLREQDLRPEPVIDRGRAAGEVLEGDRPGTDAGALAAVEVGDDVLVERVPGEADEEQHDPDVDDVAPVAAGVPLHEVHQRGRVAAAAVGPPGADAPVELVSDRHEDEGPHREAEDRVGVAHAEEHEQHAGPDAGDGGQREVPAQAVH